MQFVVKPIIFKLPSWRLGHNTFQLARIQSFEIERLYTQIMNLEISVFGFDIC